MKVLLDQDTVVLNKEDFSSLQEEVQGLECKMIARSCVSLKKSKENSWMEKKEAVEILQVHSYNKVLVQQIVELEKNIIWLQDNLERERGSLKRSNLRNSQKGRKYGESEIETRKRR